MTTPKNIILFTYPFSPYGRRVEYYLQLRAIPYARCVQPHMLPREDINALGVKYRRIPILSIGRDIYLDTRLILQKLEKRFPSGALSSSSPSERALEKLLEQWTIEGGVFARCAQLIPPETPLLKDPKFKKDREDYAGRSWQEEDIREMRPEAIAAMREFFAFLEEGLLKDGREWIAGTERPGMADVNSVWPFRWVTELPGALPKNLFSPDIYPKVYGWISRFNEAVQSAKASSAEQTTLKGADALQQITSAEFFEQDLQVDENDPLELKSGQDIEFWPTDTGANHKDRGRLLTLTQNEVVVEAQSKVGGKPVRIHAPRQGFRIRVVSGEPKM